MRVSSFYMGEHEVTACEYKRCMDAGACSFPDIDVSSKVDHYCTIIKAIICPQLRVNSSKSILRLGRGSTTNELNGNMPLHQVVKIVDFLGGIVHLVVVVRLT